MFRELHTAEPMSVFKDSPTPQLTCHLHRHQQHYHAIFTRKESHDTVKAEAVHYEDLLFHLDPFISDVPVHFSRQTV